MSKFSHKMDNYEAMVYINLCLAFGDRGWVVGDTDGNCKFIATDDEFKDDYTATIEVPPTNITSVMHAAYERYYDGIFREEVINNPKIRPLSVFTDKVGFWTEVFHDETGPKFDRLHYRFSDKTDTPQWWGQQAKWLWDFEQNPTNAIIHAHLESLKPIYAGVSIWLTATEQTWIKVNEKWLKLDIDTIEYQFDSLPDDVKQEIEIVRNIASTGDQKSLL
jgi:hypothetical protein